MRFRNPTLMRMIFGVTPEPIPTWQDKYDSAVEEIAHWNRYFNFCRQDEIEEVCYRIKAAEESRRNAFEHIKLAQCYEPHLKGERNNAL